MQTKRLGSTDLHLTRIGLGTWAIGGSDWQFSWGAQDDAESIKAINHALESGINWIDTAPVYGLGHAEEVVGKAIANLSTKPIIATKCSRVWDKDKNITANLKPESIRMEVEASLKRMQIEVIDLYQIHWPDPDEHIEEAWGALADLVNEGKIRYAGVSNFNVEQIERIQDIHPVASLQPPYSMVKREIEDGLLAYCAQNNIGVISYSPLQKGILTDKFTRHFVKNLPEDDHRCHDPRFQETQLSAHLQFVDALRGLADQRGKTVAQLAVAWVLSRPEITAAIVGARRPGQIAETVAAAGWRLEKSDLDLIDMLYGKFFQN